MKTFIHRQWLLAAALPFALMLVTFSCKDDSCPDPVCLNGGTVEAGKCDCNCDPSFKGESCETPIIPTNSLVAYYAFDGNTQDLAPVATPNHGEVPLFSSPEYVKDRKDRDLKAIYFNGMNDYVKIPHHARINFSKDAPYTISLWLKFKDDQLDTDYQTNYVLEKWGGTSSGTGHPFDLRVLNQTASATNMKRVRSGRYDGPNCSGGGSQNIHFSTVVGDNTWHHIVLWHNNTSELKIYVDGKVVREITESLSCNVENSAPLYVGCQNGSDYWYKGYVDDLRFYNRALTEGEIKALAAE